MKFSRNTLVTRALNLILTLRNALDYPLRQYFKWHRGYPAIKNEPKENMYAHLSLDQCQQAEEVAAHIRKSYHLDSFFSNSSSENYRENLFYIEFLQAALDQAAIQLPPSLAVADIGASHWFYVQGMAALLKWWRSPEGRQVELTGYEVDAYRIYSDFHARYDHAQAHMRALPGVRYLPQGFHRQPNTFDLITMLFPFVFIGDHLRWGLPRPTFAPAQLLENVWASLKAGGALVIVNQGEQEHQAQREMLLAADIQPLVAFSHNSLLFQYDLPRYVLVARRHDQQ